MPDAARPSMTGRLFIGMSGSITRSLRVLILVLLGMLHAGIATAQQYGQWSWSASLGVGSRGVSSRINGETSEDWRVDDLRVFTGVNGFVVHPAIASFEAGVDLSVLRETQGIDQDRSGYRALFRILPQSSVPVELHASRSTYGYGELAPDDPLLRRSAPDSVTAFGGRLRVRRGALAGLLVGYESTSTEFIDPRAPKGDLWERSFARWSGETSRVRHLVSFDRRLSEYGDLDYRYEDMALTIDERGEVGEHWKWNAVGSGFMRDYEYEPGSTGSTALLRLRAQASRDYESTRRLTIRYHAGSSEGDADSGEQTHQLFGEIRFPRRGAWTLTSFAGVNYLTSEAASGTAPQIGLGASWSASVNSFDLDLNLSTSILRVDQTVEWEGEKVDVGGSDLAGSVGVTVSRMGDSGFGQAFDLILSRNEFSSAGEGVPGLPDLGLGVVPAGFQDSGRARITISRQTDARRLSLWAEYGVRRFEEEMPVEDGLSGASEIEDFLVTMQLNTQGLQVLVNGGSTIAGSADDEQRVDFYSGSMNVRVARNLTLKATYLHSNQQVAVAPDITFDRIDAGAELAVGLIYVGARAFLTKERRQGGLEFESTGLEASIRRSFSGLLPIVSSPPRRGVVK